VKVGIALDKSTFERQMKLLSEQKIATSLSEFESYATGQTKIGRNKVLITMDDGDPSAYEIALPILRHYGIPAVAFVLPSAVPAFRR